MPDAVASVSGVLRAATGSSGNFDVAAGGIIDCDIHRMLHPITYHGHDEMSRTLAQSS